MSSVTKFLEGKLGLKVNAAKSKVDRPNIDSNIDIIAFETLERDASSCRNV